MITAIPCRWPVGAALWQKAQNAMDVILHIGAHRCATTSFQRFMQANAASLTKAGIGFWGPERTRTGLFHGLQPVPRIRPEPGAQRRALGRVKLHCHQTQEHGTRRLIVSDANMLGLVRANLRLAALYSGAGERIARLSEAFGERLTDILINIRSPELYWASLLGQSVSNGNIVARRPLLRRLAQTERSWRDVITDVACAAPHVRLHVLPFERFAGRPEAQLQIAAPASSPMTAARERHNATPPLEVLRHSVAPEQGALPEGRGRWMPFDESERATLREHYSDDLMWLTGGADGLATLATDPIDTKAAQDLPPTDMTRGWTDERRYSQMARAGGERTARQAS